ncbi:MAG: hypothetical protein QXD03_05310 [Candidatus Anstonellales archaeon]
MDIFKDNISLNIEGLDDTMDLKSSNIEDYIGGEGIKTSLIDESNDIDTNNYVLDMGDIEEIEDIKLRALSSFVNTEGDTSLYLLIQNKLIYIGKGYSDVLSRVLVYVVDLIFDGKVKVYREFNGKHAKLVTSKEVSKMRLRI